MNIKRTPEIERIIKKKAKNMTIAELSELIDVNPNCIRNYCNRHNISYIGEYTRVITPEIKEIIKENIKDMTLSELSRLTGIKVCTIRSYCINNGLEPKLERPGTRILSTVTINEILSNPNESVSSLAERLKISTGTVYKYRNKYKET